MQVDRVIGASHKVAGIPPGGIPHTPYIDRSVMRVRYCSRENLGFHLTNPQLTNQTPRSPMTRNEAEWRRKPRTG